MTMTTTQTTMMDIVIADEADDKDVDEDVEKDDNDIGKENDDDDADSS